MRLVLVAVLLAGASAGCAVHFDAPYPNPAFIALPLSPHSLRLERSAPTSDIDTCAGGGNVAMGAVCPRNLRRAMEEGVADVLGHLAHVAPDAEYVGSLDDLTLGATATRAGLQVWLSWQFTIRDRPGRTLLSLSDTETATSVSHSAQDARALVYQCEHHAMSTISSGVERLLASR